MVLEATLICVDNSEWTRNGDYAPTRFEAQQDAANLLCGVKTNHNIENSVGVLTMAGERVDVRVTPTNDLGLILSGLHNVRIRGESDFVRGIQTAQLALKHRMNKNQRQRIICFVASPVAADSKALETLGRQLKKNNVALDIVSFGEVDCNSDKLKKLHEAVNSNDTSNLLECPRGASQLLSDMIAGSQLVRDPDAPPPAEGADASLAGGAVNEFGVDPNVDPGLYMALRLSLEEANRPAAAAAPPPEAAAQQDTAMADAVVAPADEEMDDELRQALLLSMDDYSGDTSATSSSAQPSGDPTALRQILGSLPGVNVDDESVQAALQEAETQQKRSADDEGKKEEGKK
eukprot:GHVS01056923.1.p1 GENE.GHVS01056923.1~~GHVS01056923.1.p1  ORF type:complete len:347 (-),score=84.14 GHVS01056923.1:454-1494(-)